MNRTKKKHITIPKKRNTIKTDTIKPKKTKKSLLHNSHHHSSHHNQYKLYDRRNDTLKFQYTPKLRGGKFIDKGGFGCVITPALPCPNYDINLDKSVSKIIKKTSISLTSEITISNILKKIDPEQKFYVTINKYCVINNIPANRTDLTNVKYKDDKLSDYSIDKEDLLDKSGKKKKIDRQFCDIDLDLKPINLIMPYAGISLKSVMNSNRKNDSIKSKMHQLFVDNLKHYFKHLIIGLLKMHNNRIINKDIKQSNIMLEWQTDKADKDDPKHEPNHDLKHDSSSHNTMLVRYIDFGLSTFLTSEYCKDITNINSKGTPFYLAPEIFICSFIIKHKNLSEKYQLKKITDNIHKNVAKAYYIINEKEKIKKLDYDIIVLYKKIKYLYEKGRLLEIYFGSDSNKYNGYIQKSDVYSLGLSIYETLYKYSGINVKNNESLRKLLLHMIDINPDTRYNIVQCISDPYFSKKK